MNTQRTNREWIDGVTNDDQETYEDLYDMLRRFAFDYLMNTLYWSLQARQDFYEALVDDAAQETAIIIRKKIHLYDERAKFKTWAYSIVRYRVLDMLRKHRVEMRFGAPEEIVRTAAYYYDDVDVYLLAAIKEIIDNDLTEKQRTVLLMTLDDYTDNEIALRLGSNVNAVYKLRFDTRAKIVALIGRQ